MYRKSLLNTDIDVQTPGSLQVSFEVSSITGKVLTFGFQPVNPLFDIWKILWIFDNILCQWFLRSCQMKILISQILNYVCLKDFQCWNFENSSLCPSQLTVFQSEIPFCVLKVSSVPSLGPVLSYGFEFLFSLSLSFLIVKFANPLLNPDPLC